MEWARRMEEWKMHVSDIPLIAWYGVKEEEWKLLL